MGSSSTNLLRTARKTHRTTASALFIFFFIISLTGFLLGWKSLFDRKIYKNHTKAAVEKDMGKWLTLDSLQTLAVKALHEKLRNDITAEIDRIDIRPDKGYMGFQFRNNYMVVLNPANGTLQQIEKRNSGIILKIHEGSIVDDWLDTNFFKRVYTSLIGLSFLFLTLTGFWLWYKPKQIKKQKFHTI